MDKKLDRAGISKILVILGGAVIAALNWVLGFLPPTLYQSKLTGVFLFIIIAFAVMIWHIFDIQHENTFLKSRRTNVVADISKYATLEDVVFDRRKRKNSNVTYIKYTTQRYYLPLKQEGLGLVDTEPISTEISFYDTRCNLLKGISGGEAFWYYSRPRSRMQNRRDREIIIRKSGQVEGVCLLIKEIESNDLYAFNQSSYIPGTGDFQFQESMKIRDKIVYVKVEISDGVFDKDFWVKITNLGKNKHPLLELIDAPCPNGDFNNKKI